MFKRRITVIALTAIIPAVAIDLQVYAKSELRHGGCNPTPNNLPVCNRKASLAEATFIDPTVTIQGARNIKLAQQIYIGPFAQLQASNQAKITIDKESNVQDNVRIYAEFKRNKATKKQVKALGLHEGVEIGERVILAHGATVKGPAQIGVEGSNILVDPDDDQEVFLSFGTEVDGAILEKNTGVSALGRVGPGVRLRSGYIVLPGKNVTTQAEADDPALGKVRLLTEADVAFNEGVLEVNVAFAQEYSRLARENRSKVRGINYNPGNTEFNLNRELPELAGVPTKVPGFRNRIIGDVKLVNSLSQLNQGRVMGNRISIRADEGEHFEVGSINRMGNDVTFHALEHSDISIGNNIKYGDHVIVHGGGRRPLVGGGDNEPTIIEDNVTLKSQSIVFRSLIGQGSTVGVKSAIVNSDLAPGTSIGDRIIYLNNAFFGTVEW